MIFQDAWHIIWLIVFIPVLVLLTIKRRSHGQIKFSSIKPIQNLKPSWTLKARHVLVGLRALALCLLVLALMRPQQGLKETKVETEGVDIVLALDVSGSMMAEDFIAGGERINRLEAVKNVVREFIKKRKNDRIGLVVFGRQFRSGPLASDSASS